MMSCGGSTPELRALGPIGLVRSLTAAQIGEPQAYFNARYLLDAAAEKPIPATKTLGNLTRAFVERAFAEMRWPADYADMVRHVNKTLDEPDVGRLWLLRVALQQGGLLRKYRGAFSTTRRGRELLAPGREGELYAALFEAYFEKTNLAFMDGFPADPWLQHQVPQLLSMLQAAPAGALRLGELAERTVVDTAMWRDEPYRSAFEELCDAIRYRLLRPLEELGLVELERRPRDRARYGSWPDREVRITPLFRGFVVPAPGSPQFN